ncbi:hypothetical protein ID858_03385 [Xenorhabdus sp. DI]|uniref:hypothetical protein n=1 Tax=Xenorhabdus doucetiae TaxID=351671 RepID=UPI00198C9DA1|nr:MULTISPECIES: hypothetical protein [unclassified Xenorhabdus]MBD2785087.1 hypothetical protein [Xenorhabdus sp. 3]MBD2787550.1 hypothetical protein [Xenorhabdus sp. DI]
MKVLKKECLNDDMFYDIELSAGEIHSLVICVFELVNHLNSEQITEDLLCKDEGLLTNYGSDLLKLFDSI